MPPSPPPTRRRPRSEALVVVRNTAPQFSLRILDCRLQFSASRWGHFLLLLLLVKQVVTLAWSPPLNINKNENDLHLCRRRNLAENFVVNCSPVRVMAERVIHQAVQYSNLCNQQPSMCQGAKPDTRDPNERIALGIKNHHQGHPDCWWQGRSTSY